MLLRIVLFFVLVIGFIYLGGMKTEERFDKENAVVLRIIDGDTIETDRGIVRFLGINSPEKRFSSSKYSINFLNEFIDKNVTLIRDKEDLDIYNRKLRYVFYNNRFLNLELLELGFASSYMVNDLKFKKEILNSELQAKRFEFGIWEKSSVNCSKCIKIAELNYTYEFFLVQNSCNFECCLNNWVIKDNGNHFFDIGCLSENSEKTVYSENIWNNDGDRLFIYDDFGKLVLMYEY
jgi:endonuclease YncB( thermonuclease family)